MGVRESALAAAVATIWALWITKGLPGEGAALALVGALVAAIAGLRGAPASKGRALDALGAFLTARQRVVRAVTAVMTVSWDPLGVSLRRVASGDGGGFVVAAAPSEYHRRVVAWFYRSHDLHEVSDWEDCLARFGLTSPPPHTITCDNGDIVFLDIIIEGGRAARDMRVYSPRRGVLAHVADTPSLGKLCPRRLMKDATVALERSCAAAEAGRVVE